jgi:hypothetical protein
VPRDPSLSHSPKTRKTSDQFRCPEFLIQLPYCTHYLMHTHVVLALPCYHICPSYYNPFPEHRYREEPCPSTTDGCTALSEGACENESAFKASLGVPGHEPKCGVLGVERSGDRSWLCLSRLFRLERFPAPSTCCTIVNNFDLRTRPTPSDRALRPSPRPGLVRLVTFTAITLIRTHSKTSVPGPLQDSSHRSPLFSDLNALYDPIIIALAALFSGTRSKTSVFSTT